MSLNYFCDKLPFFLVAVLTVELFLTFVVTTEKEKLLALDQNRGTNKAYLSNKIPCD